MARNWPPWVRAQSQIKPRAPGYLDQFGLVAKFVREELAAGREVRHRDIEELLSYVDRGYRVTSKAVSRVLQRHLEAGRVQRFPNGKNVWHGATRYRSIREAADVSGLGVETVRRKASGSIDGWSFVAPQKEY